MRKVYEVLFHAMFVMFVAVGLSLITLMAIQVMMPVARKAKEPDGNAPKIIAALDSRVAVVKEQPFELGPMPKREPHPLEDLARLTRELRAIQPEVKDLAFIDVDTITVVRLVGVSKPERETFYHRSLECTAHMECVARDGEGRKYTGFVRVIYRVDLLDTGEHYFPDCVHIYSWREVK